MNRFIAKLLGGINALLFVLIVVVIPVGYISVAGKNASQEPALFFGVIIGSVLTGVVICGFVAFLARIADSLDAIKASLAHGEPVKSTAGGTGYAKCPSCGDLNAQGAELCRACGKAIAA
jgi:hypothetical protein